MEERLYTGKVHLYRHTNATRITLSKDINKINCKICLSKIKDVRVPKKCTCKLKNINKNTYNKKCKCNRCGGVL